MRVSYNLLFTNLLFMLFMLLACTEERAVPDRPRLALAMKIGEPST